VNYVGMFTLLLHQYRAVAYILTHSINLAFGPKSSLKYKRQVWTGFGLHNEARLQLW